MRTFSEASLYVSVHVGIVTQYMSVCSLLSQHSICYMDMLYNSRRPGFMLCLAGGFEQRVTPMNGCPARFLLSMFEHCKATDRPFVASGGCPSGGRPESNAAREHRGSPEADKAPEVQGTVSAVYRALVLYMADRHAWRCHGVVLFLYCHGPHLIQMFSWPTSRGWCV